LASAYAGAGQRRAAASRGAFIRRLALFALLAAVAAGLAYGGMMLATDPRFALGDVAVDGARRTAASDIIAAAALPRGRNVWLLDTGSATRSIEGLPWIASAHVERRWPNLVAITVAERTPAARVRLDAGADILVDEDGRALGPVSQDADVALPLLTVVPLPPNAGSAGAQLGQTSIGDALAAQRQLAALGVHMTEIRSEPVMGFSAVTSDGLRVIFGDLDGLAAKVALFDEINKHIAQPQTVEYVDVRSTAAPTVQYRR
jgi:cell division protein FtsQ